LDTFAKLLEFARKVGSFDGGDQGLLNLYFESWSVETISKHLPFTDNLVAHAFYSYLPAYKHFGAEVAYDIILLLKILISRRSLLTT